MCVFDCAWSLPGFFVALCVCGGRLAFGFAGLFHVGCPNIGFGFAGLFHVGCPNIGLVCFLFQRSMNLICRFFFLCMSDICFGLTGMPALFL
jgi:hypothetical protein